MAKKKSPPSLTQLFLKEYGDWLAIIDGMKTDLDLDLTDEMVALPSYADLLHMREVAELAREYPDRCDKEHLNRLIANLKHLKREAVKAERRFINSPTALAKIDAMMSAVPRNVLERASKVIWMATDAWERRKEYESRRVAYKHLVQLLRSLNKGLAPTQAQEA